MKPLRYALIVHIVFHSLSLSAQSYFDAALAPFYHGVASGDALSNKVIIWAGVTAKYTRPYPSKGGE